MKKWIIKSAVLLMTVFTIQAHGQKPVEIRGLVTANPLVKLYKVKNGDITEIANAKTMDGGKFGFLFYPEYEGLYVIGTSGNTTPVDNYMFYLKSGDKLEVALGDNDYTLTGKNNSKENIILKQWRELTFPLNQKSYNFLKARSTYVDYFPEQEKIVAQAKTFLNGKKSGNLKFDNAIETIMRMDLLSYAANFINTPRTAHPSLEEYSDFYSNMKATEIAKNTDMIYNYPWGQRTLSSVMMINMRQDKKMLNNSDRMGTLLSYVPNDTLKGDIVLSQMERIRAYPEYKLMADTYGKYILSDAQKAKSKAIMAPLLTYKAGTDAYQFSYPDKNGAKVTMASLKGKVVLVDVWATWCGPCRQEIPFLGKLEKELAGQPIEFVSISTDAEKDKDKWLAMIKEQQMGGIQLFAGVGNEFSKYYKIDGIPRFLVFDKNGKIVTIDAPRPSQPALKELLLAEAKK